MIHFEDENISFRKTTIERVSIRYACTKLTSEKVVNPNMFSSIQSLYV